MEMPTTKKKGATRPRRADALTDEQKRAAARLRDEWDRKKKALGFTQEGFAHEHGLGSQGAVWQYLRGHIPLNYPALMKFCRGLHVDPEEIYPELVRSIHGETQSDRRSNLPPDAEEIAHLYRQLTPRAQDHIRSFLLVAVTLTRNGLPVNIEPDERYLEFEKALEDDGVERRKRKAREQP